MKCKAVIFYNQHSKLIQWVTVTDLLYGLKNLGYTRFFDECPHNDYRLRRAYSIDINTRSKQSRDRYLRAALDKDRKEASELVTEIRNVNSPADEEFETILHMLNSPYSKGIDTTPTIVDGKILSYPYVLDEIMSLSPTTQRAVVKQLKHTVLKHLLSEPYGYEPKSAATLMLTTAMNENLEPHCMDVVNECELLDVDCRDKFMANNIFKACAGSHNAIVMVGLGHRNIAKILEHKGINTHQYFVVDYPKSKGPEYLENQIRSGVFGDSIMVVDLHANPSLNATDLILKQLAGEPTSSGLEDQL